MEECLKSIKVKISGVYSSGVEHLTAESRFKGPRSEKKETMERFAGRMLLLFPLWRLTVRCGQESEKVTGAFISIMEQERRRKTKWKIKTGVRLHQGRYYPENQKAIVIHDGIGTKEMSYVMVPVCFLERVSRHGTGWGNQAESGGLSELRGQSSEFKETKMVRVCRTECHRGESCRERTWDPWRGLLESSAPGIISPRLDPTLVLPNKS